MSIWVAGKARHFRVHRVVWIAAFGPTPFELDHLDGDRGNYRLDNLHPVTRQENEDRKKLRAWGAARGHDEQPQPAPF